MTKLQLRDELNRIVVEAIQRRFPNLDSDSDVEKAMVFGIVKKRLKFNITIVTDLK